MGPAFVEFGEGKGSSGMFKRVVVDLDSGKGDFGEEFVTVGQKRADMAADVEELASLWRHPADRVHEVPAAERGTLRGSVPRGGIRGHFFLSSNRKELGKSILNSLGLPVSCMAKHIWIFSPTIL